MPLPIEALPPAVESQFVDYLLAGMVLLGGGILYYFRREQNRLEEAVKAADAELATRASLEHIKDLRTDLNQAIQTREIELRGMRTEFTNEYNRAVQKRDEEMRALRAEFNNDMAALDHDIKNLAERLVDMIRTELTTMRSEHQRERAELNSRFDQMILALRMREKD